MPMDIKYPNAILYYVHLPSKNAQMWVNRPYIDPRGMTYGCVQKNRGALKWMVYNGKPY